MIISERIKRSFSTSGLNQSQSFTDLSRSTAYNNEVPHTSLQHLTIEPLNIVFVFTNPWAEKGHAVLSFVKENEPGLWDYIHKLVNTKKNRGRIEGGSYLVYAILDYIVDSYVHILHCFANDIKHIEESVGDDSVVFQVEFHSTLLFRVFFFQENWMLSIIEFSFFTLFSRFNL